MLLFGPPAMPAPLRRYVAAVGVGGPVLALVILAGTGPPSLSWTEAWLALVLTVAAAAGDHFSLHLRHQTTFSIAGAAYVAMILLLPLSVPALLAFVAVGTAQALRRVPMFEGLFNAGQSALYVTAGALAYTLVRDADARWLGPRIAGLSSIGALVVTGSVILFANTALSSTAVALQLRLQPLRLWWRNLALDLPSQAVLTALGVVGALLALDHPLALPVLALPAILVRQARREATRLNADTHEALASLVDVVELRDPATAGHSRRVAQTARVLARRLGLSAEEADVIESAGRVHDIGKVAIDPTVLTKSGKLDEADWAQIRLHPVYGANAVARFTAYKDGHRLVRHHHERWDGRGYPDGLAGEAIPLGARILAVADTFDALTGDRPYRPGMSREAAMRILEQGAGTQWDARVVAVMLDHLRETGPAPQPAPLTPAPVSG